MAKGTASSAAGTIPDALKNFDQLPSSGFVRQPIVESLYSISGATVWRWSKTGRIPKPTKLSAGITAWNVGELRQSLAAQ
ncbi:MAG: AlpA family phage regulatory protein [Burkholderiales bacterium]|nr:AlpA family phage regulatory protein [Burkholderiales bacterium]